MATKDLEQFLREIQSGRSTSPDLEAVKSEWLNGLSALYAQISAWLEPLQKEGLVKVTQKQMTIREESLGVYEAPALEVEAGGRKVFLEPIARMVFGGSGRVDMGHGPLSRVLIREPKETGHWVISAGSPSDGVQELSEKTFSDALKHLLS
jgi:hypothetical protein